MFFKGRKTMTKKEVVRSLILSPFYLKIKLKDRAELVRSLTREPGSSGSHDSNAITEGAQT